MQVVLEHNFEKKNFKTTQVLKTRHKAIFYIPTLYQKPEASFLNVNRGFKIVSI